MRQHPGQEVLLVRVSSKQWNFVTVRTETNRNSICFGCFSVCFAKQKNIFFGLFRFVSVFRTGNETTETNRTLSKQTEKIFKKRFLLGGLRNRLFFFLVRTETNRNSICFGRFSVCLFAKPKKFVSVCSMFRTSIETTETNRTYGMGN